MFRFFEKMPEELTMAIVEKLPLKDQAALAQTSSLFNNIITNTLSLKYKQKVLVQRQSRLLSLISEFNECVYYSNVAKSNDLHYGKKSILSRVEQNNIKINKRLLRIRYFIKRDLVDKLPQLLHEAMLLYFKYLSFKDGRIEQSLGFDDRQPRFMFQLILILLEFGASLNTSYTSEHSGAATSLPTRRIHNTELEAIQGLTALEYAENSRKRSPEIYFLLRKCQEKRKKELKFLSEKERGWHPQARLIPKQIWENIFKEKLSEKQMLLMRTPLQELESNECYLPCTIDYCWKGTQSLNQPEYEKELIRRWFCIALSHPEANDKQLMYFSRKMSTTSRFISFLWLAKLSLINMLLFEASNELETLLKDSQDGLELFCLAAGMGYLPLMEKAVAVWEEMTTTYFAFDDYYAFRFAAKNGHLHVLKWLNNHAPDLIKQIDYSELRLIESAAENGHLEVVKWLVDQKLYNINLFYAFEEIARNGHLEVLIWLEYNLKEELDKHINVDGLYQGLIRTAVSNKQIHILEWIKNQVPEIYAKEMAPSPFKLWLQYESARKIQYWFRFIRSKNLKPVIPQKLRPNGRV